MRRRSRQSLSLWNFPIGWGHRLGRSLLWAVIALGLTACFQSQGDGLSPTSVDVAALTPQIQPTPTLFITPLPSEGFVAPTIDPNAQIAPTVPPIPATVDPQIVQLTQQAQASIPPPPTNPAAPTPIPAGAPTQLPVTPTLAAPTASSGLQATPTSLPTDSPCEHTVQPGEWLYSIARQYNIPADKLIAANPSFANKVLQPGDKLLIPACNKTAANTANTPNAEGTVVPTTSGPQATATNGPPPTPVKLSDRVYTVATGDTLGAIATKFDTTVRAIKVANNLTSDFLSIGQQLKIPLPDESAK